MKKFILNIFLVFVFNINLTAIIQAQNVGINTDGTNPDVSAMLDIVNSSKGLLIPRISLSSTTDAATISNPATSLLIYNTNSSITGHMLLVQVTITIQVLPDRQYGED